MVAVPMMAAVLTGTAVVAAAATAAVAITAAASTNPDSRPSHPRLDGMGGRATKVDC